MARRLRVSRAFEQVHCPNCKKVILTPHVDFSTADDRTKDRIGQCIWCGKAVTFKIAATGQIIVELYGEMCADYNQLVNELSVLHTGVTLITDIAVMKRPTGEYEARVGIAIFGSVNFGSSIDANPFDPNYHDSYCRGVGPTITEALTKLRDDLESMSKTLFAES